MLSVFVRRSTLPPDAATEISEAHSMTEGRPLTADELEMVGHSLSQRGHLVVFLYPSQEWMAVETQTPFLRYEKIPAVGEEPKR
jgi:hypothetical protein